jgi:pullulanase/glycogen debranching enzyme
MVQALHKNGMRVIIRDFSMAPNSGMQYKGKYLAFTEEGTVNSFGQKNRYRPS